MTPEAEQQERQRIMAEVDALPSDIRGIVRDYNLPFARLCQSMGVKEAAEMRRIAVEDFELG